tara:strand:+ start:304 stop:474 length:171 start_codon:yes stop_codon:yes gene_type:complete
MSTLTVIVLCLLGFVVVAWLLALAFFLFACALTIFAALVVLGIVLSAFMSITDSDD